MLTIDGDRLLDDLYTLRSFGSSGTGVVRPSLTPVDLEARRWLRDRMAAAGLDATIDGVGNVFGRSPHPGPALLVGSHSDTQPTGGWLDGALGVIYGLEVARACAQHPRAAELAVDAVAWVDEESHFVSCLGSRSFCGLVEEHEIADAVDPAGRTLLGAWADAGLDGTPARRDPDRHLGYLEAHIEQGANLEREGNRIGVVTAIVGSRTYRVRFTGQQNHAGTTPMPLRRDAGRALIRFADEIDRRFAAVAGERTVWTVGRVTFHPGAASIIPGGAEMVLQFRDPDPERLATFEAELATLLDETNRAGPVEVSAELDGRAQPAAMDPSLAEHLAGAAESLAPGGWTRMPSAAIHDAMFVSRVMPSAMLFVPSIGGISHDFAENTSDEDIVLGCQVLAAAVESILSDREGS